jgi:eukaryotic-like serine/threonine-protein kinase
LSAFKDCKNLTELALPGTQVSDAGLAQFKGCKQLTYLLLNNTQVSDAGLESLKDCKDLKYLFLQNTKVAATGVDSLRKTLPQCKIEWNGGTIEPQTSLDPNREAAEYVLSIGGMVQINEASRDLKAVSELPKETFQLTTVKLTGNNQISDAGMVFFDDCINLKQLDLSHTRITDAGLAHIKDCKEMADLNVVNTKISATGFNNLKQTFPRCKIEWSGVMK